MSQEDVMKLNNEIRILMRQQHEHISKIFDWYESEDKIYLLMEFCKGGHLDTKALDDEDVNE